MNVNPIEKGTILIVDDNPPNLDILFNYLDRADFKVLIAEDGENAIARAKYAKPDLILLDVMMPGIDGFETCRRLKEASETKDIPIIFMTALANTSDKIKGFEVGAVDYITKPLRYAEVLARVKTHLTLRNLQKQLQQANTELLKVNTTLKTTNQELIETNQRLDREIIERKRAAKALEESEERYRLIAHRLQQELALAHQIQQELLLPAQPNQTGLDIVCYNAPAREVGGDFYAYHVFEEGKIGVAIGDISGKGMPAALLMTISLSLFQSLVEQHHTPRELLRHLDQALTLYTGMTGQNCALVYAEITSSISSLLEGGIGGILRVANAGCITPIIRRIDGSVEWIEVGGLPLGMDFDKPFGYREVTLTLSKGDLVILTSDGVVEANNVTNDIFGFDRLEEAVVNGPIHSAQAMLEYLKAEVAAFVNATEPHDDLTMVAVQI